MSKCPKCQKTIYANDAQISANDKTWHKLCFGCIECSVKLELKTYKSYKNEIYCAKCVPTDKPNFGSDSVEMVRSSSSEQLKRDVTLGVGQMKEQKYVSPVDSMTNTRVKDAEATKKEAGHVVRGEDRLKGDNKYTYRLSGVEFTRVKGNEQTKQDTFLVGGREQDRLLGDNSYSATVDSIEMSRVRQNEAQKVTVNNEVRIDDSSYTADPQGIEFVRVRQNEQQKNVLVNNEVRLEDPSFTADPKSLQYELVRQNEANKDVLINTNNKLHKLDN